MTPSVAATPINSGLADQLKAQIDAKKAAEATKATEAPAPPAVMVQEKGQPAEVLASA